MAEIVAKALVPTFFEAVIANNVKDVKEFLEQKKVDVNCTNENDADRTALHLACRCGYENLINLLIDDYKADINKKDRRGDAPIHVAKNNYRANIVKLLIKKNSQYVDEVAGILNGENVDEYFEAISNNDIEKVREFIKVKNVDVNEPDVGNYRKTGLNIAASKGYEELVRCLVEEFNANVNIEDEIGDLPIHCAADHNHINIVKYLVEKNSDCVEDVEDFLKNDS